MTAPSATSIVQRIFRRTRSDGPAGGSGPLQRRSRANASATAGGAILLAGILLLVVGMSWVAASGASPAGLPPFNSLASNGPKDQLGAARLSAAMGHGPGADGSPLSVIPGSAGPNITFGVVMTYDAADGYVLAVSLNASAGPFNNSYGPTELTWKFAGGNWSLLNTTGQVPATLSPGLVYDGHDQYVLLYGGRLMATSALTAPVTNQTWGYRAGTWTNLSATSNAAPFAVLFANPVYDGADEYVVLFDETGLSSTDPNGTLLTTWSYAGGVWTELTATAGAPPAFLGAMAYDEFDHYVLYYGGDTWTAQFTNATWTFVHGAWTNITASVTGAPSGKIEVGMTYDSGLGQVLVYGGVTEMYVYNGSEFSYEMWGYAAGTWTLLSSNGSTYSTQSMVYDPADSETVLLGSSNLSAALPNVVTWTYSSGSWTVAAPAFAPGLRTTDLGHAFTLYVTQSPNGGGLSYQYHGLPSGCPSVNAAQLSCVPSTLGTFTVGVTITGSGGFYATARTTVQVNPSPAVLSVAPSTSLGEVGISIAFEVAATPGSGSLTYAYLGLPPGCASSNTSYLVCVPSTAGPYDVTANVSDDIGVTAVGATHLEVVAALALSTVVADRTAIDVGQPVTITVTVGGGAAPVSYAYSGLPGGCVTVNQSSLSCQPSSTGAFSIGVRATDVLGGTAQGMSTLRVNPLPSVDSLVPTNRTINAGGSIQLAATISGGTAPFEFQYAGLPAGCAGTDTAIVSCASVASGNYSVTVTAVDATGASASAITTFESVTPAKQVLPVIASTSGPGFWWGLAIGALAIAVAGIAGGYRLVLARQGREIVQGLQTAPEGSSEVVPTSPATSDPAVDRDQ